MPQAPTMCTFTIFGQRRPLPSIEQTKKQQVQTFADIDPSNEWEPVHFFKKPEEQFKLFDGMHPQATVPHEYRDYSNEVVSKPNEHLVRGGPTNHFPEKLQDMLDQVQKDGLEHIVSWQPHGRCFVVHDAKGFVSFILPKFFKQSMLASFQRQLNLYGFQRLTKGSDKGGYYHECFLRGRRDLCEKIHRIKIKGTGVRGRANPDAEPNFWRMNWINSNGTAKPCEESCFETFQVPQSLLSMQPCLPLSTLSNPTAGIFQYGGTSSVVADNEEDFFEGMVFHAVDVKPHLIEAADDAFHSDEAHVTKEISLEDSIHTDIGNALYDETAFDELLKRLIQEA